MALIHLSSSSSLHSHFLPIRPSNFNLIHLPPRHPRSPISAVDGGNAAVETAQPKRRGRPPKSKTAVPSTSQRKTTRSRKKPESEKPQKSKEDEDLDDEMDFPYEDPPLICCFGAAQKEFVPTVRISEIQMHQDMYSTWKGMQWEPPEFARAPGGSPSNVAISHVRLGGRAAFMGKVGNDDLGSQMVYLMNMEAVQTWAVKMDPTVKTAMSYVRIVFDDDGKMRAEVVKECAEDSLKQEEVESAVLKEVKEFNWFFTLDERTLLVG